MRPIRLYATRATLILGLIAGGGAAIAQSTLAPPVTLTAEQDQADMMRQMKITALRPGPINRPGSIRPPNFDEAKANAFPDWPELMTLKNGRKVTTPDMWWKQRRPEIVEDFEREVIGRQPANTPGVAWSVVATEREMIGRTPVIARQLVGRVDNSAYPAIEVNIASMLLLPADAKGPVPVLVMFGRTAFPNPVQPTLEEMNRINAAVRASLVARDPSLAAIFQKYPAYSPAAPTPYPPPPGGGVDDRIAQLVADGWGVAMVDPATIQADNGAGLTRGIIGLVNKGQPRRPEDWGSLRAWGWGASRVLDHLLTLPEVDGKHVGIEGVSRYGKAALVTMAFDQRFAMGLIGSSGEGGVKPHRRTMGEQVENMAQTNQYHWVAGNFMKYAAAEAAFRPLYAGDIPVDSHELIALCAPRPVFISYGLPSQGDTQWLDHQGSYMAAVAAGPAWRLLGARDLGVTENYRTAKMPPHNTDMLDGELAWRQHDGGHTDTPNMKHFIRWADRLMGRPPPVS